MNKTDMIIGVISGILATAITIYVGGICFFASNLGLFVALALVPLIYFSIKAFKKVDFIGNKDIVII